MSVITAARLLPIGKSSGGIRPIAVGHTFHRLAGRLLMDSAVVTVTAHLRPEQIGVQVANAAETAARKVRLWTQDAKQKLQNEVLLQVDMKSAFGTVDLATKCLPKFEHIAPAFSPTPLLATEGPTSCLGMDTRLNLLVESNKAMYLDQLCLQSRYSQYCAS